METCRPYFRDQKGKPALKVNPVLEARNMLKHIKRDPPKRSVIAKHDLGKFVVIVERLRDGDIPFSGSIPALIHMCNLVLLSLFTAMRFNEVRCLRWDYIDLDQGFIKLPGKVEGIFGAREFRGTKNGHDHWIPLSNYALDLLQKLAQDRSPSHYVFPG